MLKERWELIVSPETNALLRFELSEMLKHCDLTETQSEEIGSLFSALESADQIVIDVT